LLRMYSMDMPWKPSICRPPAAESAMVLKGRPFTAAP